MDAAERTRLAYGYATQLRHRRTGLLHLALVLRDEAPDTFDDLFGAEASARFDDAVRRVDVPRADLDAYLAGAPDHEVVELLVGLRDVVRAALGDDRPRAVIPVEHRELATIVDDGGDVIGREQTVDQVLANLGRRTPRPVLLTGEPGTGRTAVLEALAARTFDPAYHGPLAGATVVRIAAEGLHPGRATTDLLTVIKGIRRAETPIILAIDDLEVGAGLDGTERLDLPLLRALRTALTVPRLPILVLMDASYATRLSIYAPELADELTEVALPPLEDDEVRAIATTRARTLEAHHGVRVAPEAIVHACEPKRRTERVGHPALAVQRLDEACTTVRIHGGLEVDDEDVPTTATTTLGHIDREVLGARIRADVLHQDAAVDKIVERVVLTRRRFDLQPHRPDGVFLFSGPSGVGKTSMAQSLARHLFDDDQAIIRLDMSEYGQEWSVSRLTGPQPGYVGSREPEMWLTTRVRRRPDVVIVFDEIDKAHPSVLDVFLQIFDAGRLTDARGVTADFSRAVICMTSNLSAAALGRERVGFRGRSSAERDGALDRAAAIRLLGLRKELEGRIDQTIVFEELDLAAVHDIARRRCREVRSRFASEGYDLTVEDDVIELLTRKGYERSTGCRHLNRAVEELLVHPLIDLLPGAYVGTVVDDSVRWSAPTDQSSDGQ